jgi:hypothetical protein
MPRLVKVGQLAVVHIDCLFHLGHQAACDVGCRRRRVPWRRLRDDFQHFRKANHDAETLYLIVLLQQNLGLQHPVHQPQLPITPRRQCFVMGDHHKGCSVGFGEIDHQIKHGIGGVAV